jgi:predicted nucleic acid-binding protein
VDTSAWIALFSARDQNHTEAALLFRQALARKARLTTSNLVIAELHRLILHRVGTAAALQVLIRIESSPSVFIAFASDAHHGDAKAWLAKSPSHRLTYTDAVSFAAMRDLRCAGFLGFDDHFLAAGFRPWTPG